MTNDKKLPLYGKRILVTAPRNYASRLSEVIIKKGGLPFLMPTIETTSLTDYAELDAVLRRIDEFDWIAFTSRNGINAFFQRLNVLNISLSALNNCKLCAIGKDAELLLSLCRRVDLIPAESSPVGIVNELAKIADIHQQKILAPVPEVVGMPEPDVVPNFIAGLQKLGMQVTRVPSYMTAGLDQNIYAVELDLLRQGMIDVIAFSSTVEIESFLTMVNSKSDYQHSVIACFGPYTAANAKKLGLEVAILSQDYSSFAGFADAIAQFFHKP
ncbi:uroporphyrinogen III synthase HEM4 [Tolypothrix tenuis PCC 7101]|uniref:Uroporphyrinogen III synthase HEM4 n=1 Tax=Tolypothrix tenuis PCC 7101 TaxID=231146 RepID=A0A1Z4N8Q9_9CYAN|nr:uroporphyrinogen-III synthase [Aulosira sp. FACHB-113]BAZ02042.1 uroporphyrinogen III synthase HEM4 [Tolypothrix tenuis PCC 7101]BAZ74035.1 uroporphyrinogen III synthase HEM4 [Aulosira laxa NIES-50]